MEELYALSPFKPIFIAKSVQGVGDFQVAIGGGFWVAVREQRSEAEERFLELPDIEQYTLTKKETGYSFNSSCFILIS